MSPNYDYEKQKRESDDFLRELRSLGPTVGSAPATRCPNCGSMLPFHWEWCHTNLPSQITESARPVPFETATAGGSLAGQNTELRLPPTTKEKNHE